MFHRFLRTFAVLITLISSVPLAADILIDPYTVGDTLVQVGSGFTGQTTNHFSVLGGSRDSRLQVPDLGGSELFGLVGFGGGLQLAQGNNDQIQGSLLYDNFATIDFTEGGANTNFALRIASTDMSAPINNAFWITVGSGGATSTVTFDIPANTDLADYVQIDFADFAGVDLATVDSVELGFDFAANPGAEVTISNFIATAGIPEPATVGFCLALGTLVAVRRRRRS